MIINHENKQYELNIKKAIQTGILTPIKKFNLELSVAELQTLYKILYCIGGDPATTPRKYANSMFNKVYDIIENNGLSCHTATEGFKLDNEGANNALHFKKVSD